MERLYDIDPDALGIAIALAALALMVVVAVAAKSIRRAGIRRRVRFAVQVNTERRATKAVRETAAKRQAAEDRRAFIKANPIVDCPCGVRARHHVMRPRCDGKTLDGTHQPCRREFRGREHWHFQCRSCFDRFALASGFVQAEIAAELATPAAQIPTAPYRMARPTVAAGGTP